MKRTTVAEEWLHFRKMGMPRTAGAGQVRDMQAAFYAGAAVCFRLLAETSDDVQQSDAQVEALIMECSQFFLSIDTGESKSAH